MTDSPLQTEFSFTLPKGYVDDEGTVHTEGRMRLATAADEIQPLNDPRVQENASYLTIILLSRVVTQIGTVDDVTTDVIESLFISDLAHLQQLYEQVNNAGTDFAGVMDDGSAAGSPPDGAPMANASSVDDGASADSSTSADGGVAADDDLLGAVDREAEAGNEATR